MNVDICPECGVPEPFNQGQAWLDNGDIVQRVNDKARIAFMECENLDPLFKGIGDIIGMPIEPLVINIAARGTKTYLNGLIPKEVKEMIRAKKVSLTPLIDSVITYCQIVGFGKYEFLDYRYENDADDYSRQRVIDKMKAPV